MSQQGNTLFSPTDSRQADLFRWLNEVVTEPILSWEPLVGDASFRRYFRLQTANGSYIVMDAPPDKENTERFVMIARALHQRGLLAPNIIAENVKDGFLILTDFGNITYLHALKTRSPEILYKNALKTLVRLQDKKTAQGLSLPHFNADWMYEEWALHQEWFLQQFLHLSKADHALQSAYDALIQSALSQPHVFMHRDFHAGNLMLLPHDEVGLLDFQDAFMGPLTYDLASILRDCYIDWPREKVTKWALFYYHLLRLEGELQSISEEQFLNWFDWMSIQRHLKAVMIFARKSLRDDVHHYLTFIPRTLNYIVSVSAGYRELAAITSFYQSIVVPAFMSRQT